jgi:prepilin-type N-terminal cleavage/methylation domain-containing protein
MSRSGYTLLEILLALAIAVLLLAGLYVAVDTQIRLAEVGRQRVEETTVVRSVFDRMDNDASCVIGQSDPARFRLRQSGASSAGGATGGSTGGAATGGGATGGSSGGGASGSGSSSSTPITSMSANGTVSTYTNQSGVQVILLPYGVQGDAQHLNMFICRVPREMINDQLQQQEGSSTTAGDLRRVSYWLNGDNGSGQGLMKQEVPLITSDDAGAIDLSALPPGSGNNADDSTVKVVIEEVRSLQFEYYDGTNWIDTWDSTALSTAAGADGVTPQGSPVAIRVTLEIAQPGQAEPKRYQHVIAFLTASGTTILSSSNSTNPSTTGGGTSSP